MKQNQLSHQQISTSKQLKEIIILCDGVSSPSNIGSIFRLADAFGVKQIIFSNCNINLNSSRLTRTARNTEKTVDYLEVDNTNSAILSFKEKDFKIIALEITDTSTSLEKFKDPENHKFILVVGNEQNGISKAVLELVDVSLYIEMFGLNSSINVAQATGIALYSITNFS